MASMIERVAATEAQAAQRMREAAENARQAVAEAEQEAAQTLSLARENARELLRERAEASRRQSEGDMQRILEESERATEALCAAARARIPEAAAYILGEVTK